MTEEEVKLNYITPAIEKSGWKKSQIKMEYSINDGKIEVENNITKRKRNLKADYVLFFSDNLPLAVVEAKHDRHLIGDGMLQAKQYAKKLDIRFAFTSNGSNFLFYDMKTGEEKELNLNEFPSPQDLYDKQYKNDVKESEKFFKIINTPYYYGEQSYPPRYYQRIAINRVVEAISKEQEKILLVMATGTGKTYVAFQIIWRLWQSGLKKKILYLADRNILLDQTIIGDFKPFKNAMTKITNRKMDTSYEIYLSLYQQLSENNNDLNDTLATLKENFNPNFFDLIIVDECHRGSARENSNWRKILDYFESATKIGMTATPKETKEVSNVDYFGEPIYTYSLKDGIEDGYLAPYRVIRYVLDSDYFGYQPEKGKTDIYGNLIENREYNVKDFDRTIIIDERTKLIAKQITNYLRETNPYNKTIVFCVDIDHAERMRQELTKLNSDLCAKDHRYIMRITGDDGEGKKQLDNFIDSNSLYPTIVTTSKLLTTGVNCKTCKNIVLDNIFGENGASEFKQIIGRGTRIDEKHGKTFFTILDFRNATRLFSDPNFNGPIVENIEYDPKNNSKIKFKDIKIECGLSPYINENRIKKFHINGVEIEIIYEKIQYYDEKGELVTESLKDFTKKRILHSYKSLDDFLTLWTSEKRKEAIKKELEEKGIFLEELRNLYPANVDEFDLICDIAYGIKPLTKSERIKNPIVYNVLNNYSKKCRDILEILLNKYSNNEIDDFTDTKILNLPEFNDYGNPIKIAELFGGLQEYLNAVHTIQNALYVTR